MIDGFRPVGCVSVFQGSFPVLVIMIDAAKNAIVTGDFCSQSSPIFVKRSMQPPEKDHAIQVKFLFHL